MAIRLAIDAYDGDQEVEGGLARDMRDHFGVTSTPEILARVVRLALGHDMILDYLLI